MTLYPNRAYSSPAQPTVLNAAITAGATTMVIPSNPATLNWPATPNGTTAPPYTLLLDWGSNIAQGTSGAAEVVLVTGVAANTPSAGLYQLTITRGQDGTTGAIHNPPGSGSNVYHGSSGQDFGEYQTHETSTGATTYPGNSNSPLNPVHVHGIGEGSNGSVVVGTLETQTLKNKTLTDASNTLPALNTIAANSATSGSVAMNNNKLTGLANGSASGDSVAYGQLGSAAFDAASAFDTAGAASTAQSNAEAASLPVGATISVTSPLQTTSTALSSNPTHSIQASSTSQAGYMSAAQATTLAGPAGTGLITGENGIYDVSQYGVTVSALGGSVPSNTVQTANVTALNTLLTTTAATGSTIWFPPGVVYLNASLNSGAALSRAFQFTGSFGNSYIAMTAAVTTPWIYVYQTANNPSSFTGLTFFSYSVNQTAAAVIQLGTANGCLVANCNFSGGGNTSSGYGGTNHTFNAIDMTNSGGTQANAGNGVVIANCNFGQVAGSCVTLTNGSGSTLVVGCLGAGGLASGGNGAAGVTVVTASANVGAMLVDSCDFIAFTNNVSITATAGQQVASFDAINSFFDQGVTNSVLVVGAAGATAGNVTRCRFSSCYIGIAAGSTGANAVNIGGANTSNAHTGIEFNDCFILNANGNTGTTSTGILASQIADLNVDNCLIGGFNGSSGIGISVTSYATAGICTPKITNCQIGPFGGLATNTLGISLLGATTYGTVSINNNMLNGNTTPLSLVSGFAVASGAQFLLANNTGLPICGSTTAYTASSVLAATTVTTVGSITIPVNSLRAGQRFRLSLYMTTAATAGTCTVAVTLGTAPTTVASIVATNPADAGSWLCEFNLIMTGAAAATCFAQINGTTTDTTFVDTAVGIGSGTTTASGIADASNTTLNLTADASAASTWTVWGANIEVLQQ